MIPSPPSAALGHETLVVVTILLTTTLGLLLLLWQSCPWHAFFGKRRNRAGDPSFNRFYTQSCNTFWAAAGSVA